MSEKYELHPDVVLSQGEEWAWKHAIVKEFIKEAHSWGFKDGRQSMLAERDAAIARAEAAEAQVERLREALAPFVAHYEPWMDERPDTDRCWSSPIMNMGTVRNLRAALAGKEPSDG